VDRDQSPPTTHNYRLVESLTPRLPIWQILILVTIKDLVALQHQKLVTKISQTRCPMRYDISIFFLRLAASQGDQTIPWPTCSLFPFPVPTTLHSGNSCSLFLFPQEFGERPTLQKTKKEVLVCWIVNISTERQANKTLLILLFQITSSTLSDGK